MGTENKRLLRALSGEAVWPPPVWLMRQAGRYLPEYRKVRAQAGDFVALCTNPALATEVTLQPIRRYGFDAAILFSDILMLPWALGHGLEFKEGEGPCLPPLRDAAGVAALDPGRLPKAIEPILDIVRGIRAGLEAEGYGDRTLIGFAGSPFTVACFMIEGGGSKEFAATRGMAYSEPELLDSLIEVLTDATVTYLAAQIDAGAEAVMLFDSWAGVLSPSLFRDLVIAPTAAIVAELRRRYPAVPVIGFPRLAGVMIGSYASVTGIQGVAMDTAADPTIAASLVPPGIAIQGNLDPLAVVAGGEVMASEARAILDAMRGRPFIFNLGHGIVPPTPPENVAALMEIVRAA